MPLAKTRRNLVDAQAEIIRLNIEIARLEHALTTAKILSAVLVTPEQIVLNLANELTPRETDVLVRIMAGDTVDQMARQFYLSQSTVKVHIGHIYHKVGAHNRSGAAMAGIRLGLSIPEEKQP